MIAGIGMAGAELLTRASLPKPLQLLTGAVNTFRFGRNIKQIAYTIQKNPADFAAGFLMQLIVGDHPVVKLASQIALISRSTLELYDAHKALIRSWQDFGSLKNHIPIEIIKHSCKQKKSTAHTLVKALPDSCATVIVKMQDVSYLVNELSKAILNYLSAWDTLYCACHLDTLTQFSANTQVFTNIKASYKKLSENKSELIQLLQAMPGPVNTLLQRAHIPLTTEKIIADLTQNSMSTVKMPGRDSVGFGKKVISFLEEVLFTFTHIAANISIAILPTSDPKDHPKQPQLQPRAKNGYNSSSYSTRQTSSRHSPRRFYKTS